MVFEAIDACSDTNEPGGGDACVLAVSNEKPSGRGNSEGTIDVRGAKRFAESACPDGCHYSLDRHFGRSGHPATLVVLGSSDVILVLWVC